MSAATMTENVFRNISIDMSCLNEVVSFIVNTFMIFAHNNPHLWMQTTFMIILCLYLIYRKLRIKELSLPAFFIFSPNISLCSHQGFSMSLILCSFVALFFFCNKQKYVDCSLHDWNIKCTIKVT